MSEPTTDSRTAILDVAQRLFVEKGYTGLAMREIAEAVGLTKPALYYHFRNKEELFVAILDQLLADLTKIIDQADTDKRSTRQQIEGLVAVILALPVQQRSTLRLASQELTHLDAATRQRFLERYHTGFIGRITALLEHGVQVGELRRIDPHLATWTLLGMLFPYLHPTPATGIAPSAALTEQMLSIYFDGVAQA